MARMSDRLCPCGSLHQSRELLDARGIYCGRVCDLCEEKKKAEFRPEIFTDPNYAVDEPIDDDGDDPDALQQEIEYIDSILNEK